MMWPRVAEMCNWDLAWISSLGSPIWFFNLIFPTACLQTEPCSPCRNIPHVSTDNLERNPFPLWFAPVLAVSQNHRAVWAGRDLKDPPAPILLSLPRAGCCCWRNSPITQPQMTEAQTSVSQILRQRSWLGTESLNGFSGWFWCVQHTVKDGTIPLSVLQIENYCFHKCLGREQLG